MHEIKKPAQMLVDFPAIIRFLMSTYVCYVEIFMFTFYPPLLHLYVCVCSHYIFQTNR